MSQFDRFNDEYEPTETGLGYVEDVVCPRCFTGGTRVADETVEGERFDCTSDGCEVDSFAVGDEEKFVLAP